MTIVHKSCGAVTKGPINNAAIRECPNCGMVLARNCRVVEEPKRAEDMETLLATEYLHHGRETYILHVNGEFKGVWCEECGEIGVPKK